MKKEYYQRLAKKMKLPNAYTAAITEFMRKPSVGDVKVIKAKDGKSTVKVNAFKKGFDVQRVKVVVVDKNNAKVSFDLNRLKGENLWVGELGVLKDVISLEVVVVDGFGNEGVKFIRN